MVDPTVSPIPELLAPAGGPEALRAAVANGADAVYLGLPELNARRGAVNFTLETLAPAVRHAHLHGVRVYLTANVLVLPDEAGPALDMVARAWEAGIDAVIVQDLGLISLLRAELPDVRIHASTQVDTHNAAGIVALQSLGVSRVTLARELSVDEIAGLVRTSGVELESFVHGSLCYCHSGQCQFSSMIGGRSANRGTCAQPCRLPYDLLGADGSAYDVPGKYILSPKDLAGVTLLPALVRSGVAALKIEGRMKSPEYVATVVRVYRAALDRAAADPGGYQVSAAEWDLLSEAFSRGFSEAYLSDVRDDSMMSYQRPNNRGVPVGRVVSTGSGVATVALDRAVESADRLEFWTAAGRFTQAAGPLRLDGTSLSAAPVGVRVELIVEGATRAGDRVFRVANAALLEAARRTFTGEDRAATPAVFAVRLLHGEPASVTVEAAGLTATAEGPVVEAARTRAVSAEEVVEHVGRLGGSGYAASEWRLELGSDVGIGFSVLHALRREALAGLDAQRLAPWEGRQAPRGLHADPPSVPGRATSVIPELVVAASDVDVAVAALRAGANRALLAVTSLDTTGTLRAGVEPLLPRIAHPLDVEPLLRLAEGRAATSGNLGLLAALGADQVSREAGLSADWGLGAVNGWTAEALATLGASLIWASPELSGRQLARLVRESPVAIGATVQGRVELMIAEHCVLQASGACSHDCARCLRRTRANTLRDRKGYGFPVTTDARGFAHIYNSVPLDLSRALLEVLDAGVSAVRIELHTETPASATRIVSAYRRLLADAAAGRAASDPLEDPSTSGHFFRGLT
ncbi:MAG: U32 family peptidase [Coriobacteriia bacterium]|nr:U32 family peptidase [Coriobacteriia bacterium]